MNRLGQRAAELWALLAPGLRDQVEDAEAFFTRLGEDAQVHLDTIRDALIATGQQEVDYFAELGRIENCAQRAGEIVEADWLMPPADAIEDGGTPLTPRQEYEAMPSLEAWLQLRIARLADQLTAGGGSFDPSWVIPVGMAVETAVSCCESWRTLQQLAVEFGSLGDDAKARLLATSCPQPEHDGKDLS